MIHQTTIVLLFILASSVVSYATQPRLDIGFEAGTLKPNSETVGRDALFKLGLGIYDPNSGFEFRGNIGFFSNVSTSPDLIGSEFRMDISPLTASLFYHFGTPDSLLQPFVGGGVGGYFYKVSDYTYGQLESGTKFAPHASAGVKVNVSQSFFISAEYTHAFLNRTFFNTPDFNLSEITVGFGFKLEPAFGPRPGETTRRVNDSNALPDSAESRSDERQQLVDEIKKMTVARDKIESKIDAFYETADIETRTGFITAKLNESPLIGTSMTITEPVTNRVVASGGIETINDTQTEWQVTLNNADGWKITVTISKASTYVVVGNRPVLGITSDNINTVVEVSTVSLNRDTTKELRKIQYYEEKLKVIDQKIAAAKSDLSKLRQDKKMWNTRNEAPQSTSTTVIIDDRYPTYYPPPYYDPYRYRYYSPIDYAAPTYLAETPSTPEERAAYIQKKRDHILKLKSRK